MDVWLAVGDFGKIEVGLAVVPQLSSSSAKVQSIILLHLLLGDKHSPSLHRKPSQISGKTIPEAKYKYD